MKSKWLKFILVENKTSIWCVNHKSLGISLGIIKWYSYWRQYCFFPLNGTIYSQSCIIDIAKFIKEQMDKRKK